METTEALKLKKIAVIGFSKNPYRDSNRIAIYLKNAGYTVYGVNPGQAGNTIEGIECFGKISDIKDQVEIVNVFRNPDSLPALISEIEELSYKPQVIWTQLGVINHEARERAEKDGFNYIENKCIYVEHKLYM